MELIVLSSGCDTKTMYYREIEDWLNQIWLNLEIVEKCSKFLNIDSFCKEYYIAYFLYSYICNSKFLYRIKKVIRNIAINILGHEGKKLWDGDEFIKIIRNG